MIVVDILRSYKVEYQSSVPEGTEQTGESSKEENYSDSLADFSAPGIYIGL